MEDTGKYTARFPNGLLAISHTSLVMMFIYWSCSSISWALKCWDSGIRFPAGPGNFSLLHLVWGLPCLLSNGYRGFFPLGVKRSGPETRHSPPSSALVQKAWPCTPTPQYSFMVWCLVKLHSFFYLGARWRWVVSFTPRPLYPQGKNPRYPLDKRLGGPQSRSGRGGSEKNSQLPPGIEP
jgi:hypothetical protein